MQLGCAAGPGLPVLNHSRCRQLNRVLSIADALLHVRRQLHASSSAAIAARSIDGNA